jgi:hypothetical protein
MRHTEGPGQCNHLFKDRGEKREGGIFFLSMFFNEEVVKCLSKRENQGIVPASHHSFFWASKQY